MLQKMLSIVARGIGRVTLTIGVLGVGAVALSLLLTPRGTPDDALSQQESVEQGGWGSAAISTLQGNLHQLSPIRLANACGLGASSCFKCHNGKRAGAPTSQPWHDDHAHVNNSCGGCHGGNPRLMKEGIAHRGMVGDSLSQPEKFCFKCHAGDDGQALLNKYVAIKGGEK